MKLLNCIACQDIVKLLIDEERTCRCGRSRGKYRAGGVIAEYAGPARVFGLRSLDYHRAEPGHEYTWWVLRGDSDHLRRVDRSE